MKVSLSWLQDYVPIEMEVNSLADALTMVGLEVEAISDRFDYLERVIVGRVITVAPHPEAKRLKLCDVDIGNRIISVVCGAPNVNKDLLAPVALPGTTFPDGTLLEKNVIRGITSEGMLCSEAELGLGPDRAGVMVLGQNLSVGDKLAKALELSDPVFEIDLTPNRPDCLSIIGVAREIAALQKTKLKYPDTGLSDSIDNISRLTSVTIKTPDLCPRYAARLLEDITVAPSPFWLQDRLISVGLRPINNIVDITNFVMMETGQPLHAFDFDRLAENRIVVRTASEGETFTTLDQKERILSPGMLMICDGEKPVALAGIMGGLNSEIEESTTRVLIESAYFNPACIRRTSKKFGLNTDASHRFERGVDPQGTIVALNRSARLMAEIGGGRIIEGIIDEHPGPQPTRTIILSVRDTNSHLGTDLDQKEIGDLLKSIEFKVVPDDKSDDQDRLIVIPPSFRVDITRPTDLMEEVARLLGYNNIPTTFPLIPAEVRQPARRLELRSRIKNIMTGYGFTEVINYSFISSLSCDRLLLEANDRRRNLVQILNPLTDDQAVMRTSLIPGLLETMHRNLARQVRNLKIFEVGNIYLSTGKNSLPEEVEMIAGLWTGARFDPSWHFKEVDCDYYDIKGVVEGLLNGLKVNNILFTGLPNDWCPYTRPGYTARIIAGKEFIGLVGEVRSQVLRNFDLSRPAFIFELNLQTLAALIPDTYQSKPIPKLPAIARDLTIIINKDIEARTIQESIRNVNEKLVEEIYLFDVFEGDPIPAGKKSLSFRIIYRSSTETLKDEEVNHIHKTISERLLEEFEAALPAS